MRYIFIFLTTFVNAQSWIRLPDFPGTKRDDGIAVVVNNKAYFGTGMEEGWATNRDFQALDINNFTWSSISPMSTGNQRQYANAFPGPGCFFVFGGEGSSNMLNSMQRYDVATDTWTSVAPKPGGGVMAASCMVFGDNVIIAGGKINVNGPATAEVWQYKISTNTWTQKNNYPFTARWRSSAAVLNNKGYLLFGIDDSSDFRKELYCYDAVADTWNKVSDFPGVGRAYATMQADSKKLVVFGGHDKQNFYNDTWYYFDSLNVWAQGPSLPGIKRRGDMSCLTNGKFLISCGLGEGDIRLNETWMMDVPTGVGEKENADFKIYPNPAKDIIFVNIAQQDEARFEVSDMYGKKYELDLKYNSAIGTYEIDLKNLQQGVYFLSMYSYGRNIMVKKILKE